MTPEHQARYSRHVLLPQLGERGQERISAARVLLVGLGGLGSPASMYLAASGVGHLVLSDYDFVEISNLQRQIVHASADVGRDKVDSARDRLLALNPEIEVSALARALDDDELEREVRLADVVVDACDNFTTRFALNAACFRAAVPLVSAAAIRFEGHVSVFDPRLDTSPCYRCLYVPESAEGEACSQVGVFAPLLGLVGSMQAAETLKLVAGIGESLAGRLLVLDALHAEWRALRVRKDPQCPVCSAPRAQLAEPELAEIARL